MSARRFLMGCTVTAGVVCVIAIIGGVVAYKRLTVSVPLPDDEELVDAASVGHAVLRLDPGNLWVQEMFSRMSKVSTRQHRAEDMFPIELVWSARKVSDESEGHTLAISLSPRGRLFGLASDLALWRIGRSNDGKVSRVEYGGEGITTFPGSGIPGSVFVRGSSIVWSSDLDTARRAVDLVVAREKAESGGEGPSPVGGAAARPEFLELMPRPGTHALVGAISGENGAPARCLGLLPGAAFDIPEDELAHADVSFAFDATSGDAGAGEISLRFPADTSAATVDAAAGDIARRIAGVTWGQIAFEATPRVEPPRGVIAVKATGLSSVYGRLFEEAIRIQKKMEKARAGAGSGGVSAEDPNQSSSTFQ